MRRVILLALLALALPTAALAGSIDYANGGFLSNGTATVGGSATVGGTVSIGSQLTQINFVTLGTPGWVSVTTGTLSASGTAGLFDFTGGTITIKNGGGTSLFQGTFSSGTVQTGLGGSVVVTGYVNGIAVTTQLSSAGAVSGNTIVTPEPGTLGLLGTGLVGLAGVVRRKLRG